MSPSCCNMKYTFFLLVKPSKLLFGIMGLQKNGLFNKKSKSYISNQEKSIFSNNYQNFSFCSILEVRPPNDSYRLLVFEKNTKKYISSLFWPIKGKCWSCFFPYISLNLCVIKSVIHIKISNFF